MAKGSGMIHPQMATMLAFLTQPMRRSTRACSDPCSDRRSSGPSTRCRSTATPPPTTPSSCSPTGRPAVRRSASEDRATFAEALEARLPLAGDRHRGRRGGRAAPDRGDRQRRVRRRERASGRADHRGLVAGQDGGPRCGPELGPHRRRGGTQRGPPRPGSACESASATLPSTTALRSPSTSAAHARILRRADGAVRARPDGRQWQRDRLGLRPLRGVRRHQQ